MVEVNVTSNGVRSVADLNPFDRDARRAFFVPSDEIFGLVRMYWAYTDRGSDSLRIFRTLTTLKVRLKI